MKKRTVILGTYDTASFGWTLAACKISDPEQKTNYVEKTGGDGSWDMSTVLTDGIPRYKNRSLEISLECSEGSRDYREQLIGTLVNQLDGLEHKIILPDHPEHYLVGRLHVAEEKNTLAHAILKITGTVEPWFYSARETVVEINATAHNEEHYLFNEGRRAVVPVLTSTGNILLRYNGASIQLTNNGNTYRWPALLLTTGAHKIEVSGAGVLTLSYREGKLR